MDENYINVTWGHKKTRIMLPDGDPVREWNFNNKVKFYDRGARMRINYTKKGYIKPPRSETQIYVNGKYFLQVHRLNENGRKVVLRVIYVLYCYGFDWDEIKNTCKKCFYSTT